MTSKGRMEDESYLIKYVEEILTFYRLSFLINFTGGWMIQCAIEVCKASSRPTRKFNFSLDGEQGEHVKQ